MVTIYDSISSSVIVRVFVHFIIARLEDSEPYGKIINGPWVVSRKVEKKKLLFLPYNGTALTRNCICEWDLGVKKTNI